MLLEAIAIVCVEEYFKQAMPIANAAASCGDFSFKGKADNGGSSATVMHMQSKCFSNT